ncbi:hypothetical protein ACHAPE_004067 [Trichoderma viride]
MLGPKSEDGSDEERIIGLGDFVISLLISVALGPYGANFKQPDPYLEYRTSAISDADCFDQRLEIIMLNLSKILLGI